ncbi:unnamed protein product [Blepharisma stoltei]|uniref:Phosphatidylinositol-4,5-bisphosphate 4-phosphatase n=1 Tax=Blepharisma stoltei TaxID=1481888 RepID=A0AAU9K876_9CILI|nr:unnamed protein product [Blepharisma stoltei]
MSQKRPVDIELKPMSSRTYPDEPPSPEHTIIEETKSPTPIYTPPPPPPIFNQPNPLNPAPRPQSQTFTPQMQFPPNNFSGQQGTIKCATCSLAMAFPIEAYFVTCPACRNVTATKHLIPMVCTYCQVRSYFPMEAETVRCPCGAIYSNPYRR